MTRRFNKKILLLLIPAFLCLLFIFILLNNNAPVDAKSLADGIEYVKTLETKDIESVKSTISDYRREEKKRLLSEGEISVWDMFEDYLIMGDSRAVGFPYHEFLDWSRCIVFGGANIRNIEEHYDEITALNPRYIFLCFGLNDVGIGYWETPEEYAQEYKEIVLDMQERYPNAQIVISSILVARDPAFESNSAWRRIPEFNEVLMKMCIENGFRYADNTALCEQYADLWDVDGIHIKKDFYPYWAVNLIAEVDDEN